MTKVGSAVRFAGLVVTLVTLCAACAFANDDRVKTESGVVEGVAAPSTGVRIFRGIPFATPPVGVLRWKTPQPVKPWKEVRKAAEFGPRCMQAPIYPDMIFRDQAGKPMSEDCLYLNVWTPAKSAKDGLAVMLWFYGGGFQAGSSSGPRYDGETLATKGIIVVSVNYRLGIFGFLSHPELTKESREHASGNYGLMDQIAGLRWVKKNIAAFGGDPEKITIAGESAGSLSVSALMDSRGDWRERRVLRTSSCRFGDAAVERNGKDGSKIRSIYRSKRFGGSARKDRGRPAGRGTERSFSALLA